ncbi:hypothetical protein [Leptospira alstonii]|uniref:Uncharacterized protein n=1 Tax=Leptospira alstonii serovar Sichuan str. 79601 TaxID=1218565 RepID=M6CYF8_9LEPT|nr:hypothetical protein [Leptospira alstonii]AGS80466.1 hypothetical protein LEP1GSC193_0743 [Leptospira phage vB_LalZ_80412-LE1]EMJ95531.1 hypothetical protein LEP1GSC194_3543 [Leptospira alstonii serovar Sichuan str. 79601]
MANFESLYAKGKFPRTRFLLEKIAVSAKDSWTHNTLSAKPAWWGKMAMSNRTGGGGGILIKKIPGGYQVFHPNKGKYNYMAVIERGRRRYDMRPALLGGSRARMGENGPYVIVPVTKNENKTPVSPKNNSINSVIIKTGSFKEENAHGKLVTRNRYKYRQDPGMTGRGNVFASEQVYKNGHVQRSFVKFVVVTERSTDFFQSVIPAQRVLGRVKEDVNRALKSKQLKSAVALDTKDLISELLSKKRK